jgi:hypothetical protein
LAERIDDAVASDLASQLAFSWTSPLAGRPDQFSTTEGLFGEQAMVHVAQWLLLVSATVSNGAMAS